MTEMIEQVAKALASERYVHCGGALPDTLVTGKPNWVFCIPDARLAIRAMRKPSETMLNEGIYLGDVTKSELTTYYEAMIDTALGVDFSAVTNGER